ncbi:hypothetical protein F4775DRAFT_548644 [Biscogniauxia sp. FL1348]|nr:hypothetical protein F4775DRAFT_548644 [Biscogniauxia sp. FL1348]
MVTETSLRSLDLVRGVFSFGLVIPIHCGSIPSLSMALLYASCCLVCSTHLVLALVLLVRRPSS